MRQRPQIASTMSTTSTPDATEVAPWVLTLLLAVGQATAVALIVVIGSPDIARQDYGAFLFAAGFGALLLLRHLFPVAMLAVSVLAVFTYYAADYPPIGMAVPVVGAFYGAAERGRVAVATVAGVVLLAVSLFFRSADGESSVVLAYDLITNVALIGCAIALALVVRNRRALRAQHQRVLSLERRHQQELAAVEVEAERVRIARDVHDSTGHALSVVSVQARVAQQALDDDDHRAVDGALQHIVAATSTSLADLRRTLTVLQSDDASTDRAPLTINGIQRTVQAARDAGLAVRYTLDVGSAALPAPTATAAFRIVQEAVTNVLRHAQAQEMDVVVRVKDDDLYLRVVDDGVGADTAATARGRGVKGMRERAELLGGDVRVTSSPTGWTVDARLPLGPSR